MFYSFQCGLGTYISSPCTAKVTNTGSHWLVEHSRFHCHPTPSLARRSLDPQSLKQLENIVRIAPELSPLQLKMGMGRRENASSIDPTLQNLDRIRFEKKKIMKKSNYVTSKLSDVVWGEGGWVLFKLRWSLTTSYVDHGHVVKQFSENTEIRMSLVAHFKRSCGTLTFDWLYVVWALQGERDCLIVLPGVLPTYVPCICCWF